MLNQNIGAGEEQRLAHQRWEKLGRRSGQEGWVAILLKDKIEGQSIHRSLILMGTAASTHLENVLQENIIQS